METKAKTASTSVRTLATLAMLAAMAYVLMWVSHAIPKVSGFLQFDLKDIPIVIGGFIYGPLGALAISVAVALLELVTVSTTGPIGLVMNILSCCSIACVASLVYGRWRSLSGAVAGLVLGVLGMTAVMLLWNFLITPLYMKVGRDVVVEMLLPVFLPFNLLKGTTNATLTLLLYKPLVLGLRRASLAPQRAAAQGAGAPAFRLNLGVMLAALFLVITCALLLLIWLGMI